MFIRKFEGNILFSSEDYELKIKKHIVVKVFVHKIK